VKGENLKDQKANLEKAIDERIKELKKAEQADEHFPGRIEVKIGGTTFTLHDTSEALALFRKRTGKLTGKIGFQGGEGEEAQSATGAPTSFKAPPGPPKTILASLAKRKMKYVPVTTKPPKGDPVLWTTGNIIDMGEIPKGHKKDPDRPGVDYPVVKNIWDDSRKLISAENQVVGDMQFRIDEGTGKPTDARITSKQGQILGVNPQYVAYFKAKHPDAKFYFELGAKDKQGMISVVSKDEQVGVIASLSWGEEGPAPAFWEERDFVETGKVPIIEGGVLHPKSVLEREKFFPNYKGRKATEVAIDGAVLLTDPVEYDAWLEMVRFNVGDANATIIDKEARTLYKKWTERTDATLDKVQEFYKAGKGNIGWYERSRKAIEKQYGKDADIFTQFFAITSAGMKTTTNTTLAKNAYRQWKKGDREFKNFRHGMRVNLKKAARGEPWYDQLYREKRPGQIEPEYRKTGNFYKALRGDESAVVVDLWVRRSFG